MGTLTRSFILLISAVADATMLWMAVGSKANAFDLDGVTVPVTCVGDCSGERTADIASAIRTAYHAANEL